MDLPLEFTEQMRALLGDEELGLLRSALEEKPPVSVRANCKHPTPQLATGPAVAWSSVGHYLTERPSFTLDPHFHAGAYYVQEASSMFVEQALRQCGTPRTVLDFCAAPGGKSTLLRSLLPNDSLLVCNEPVKGRANVLAENMIKWGHEGCLVCCNYPRDIARLGAVFDLVLVDAPCSGEGMFRKDNPAMEMWSPANVRDCQQRQREIVETIWPALKSGGYLIYSTCTYNTRENEDNVRYFCDRLGAELVEIPLDTQWRIRGSLLKDFSGPVYHFLPHLTKGEGFFLALMRKTATEPPTTIKTKTNAKPLSREWAGKISADNMVEMEWENTTYAIMSTHAAMIGKMCSTLYPLHMGTGLFERKGSKQVPHHSLAMSRLLRPDAYPAADLTLDESLAYLRHEAIRIDAPKGYALVRYEGLPLGFVNNLGNRANNLYPAEWRIRH